MNEKVVSGGLLTNSDVITKEKSSDQERTKPTLPLLPFRKKKKKSYIMAVPPMKRTNVRILNQVVVSLPCAIIRYPFLCSSYSIFRLACPRKLTKFFLLKTSHLKSRRRSFTTCLENMGLFSKLDCMFSRGFFFFFFSILLPDAFFLLRGTTPETRGTAFVVYEDIYDAKNACEHLSGFNVSNR